MLLHVYYFLLTLISLRYDLAFKILYHFQFFTCKTEQSKVCNLNKMSKNESPSSQFLSFHTLGHYPCNL